RSAADLDLVGPEVEGMAAELEHADLERHARSRGRLLEDHGQRLAAQGAGVGPRIGLEPARELEDLLELLPRVVPKRDEMLLLHAVKGDDTRRADGHAHPRRDPRRRPRGAYGRTQGPPRAGR